MILGVSVWGNVAYHESLEMHAMAIVLTASIIFTFRIIFLKSLVSSSCDKGKM